MNRNTNRNKEKIKIYIVIGLSVILMISGYFRLIHAKIKTNPTSSVLPKGDMTTSAQPPVSINMPDPKSDLKSDLKVDIPKPKPSSEPTTVDFLQAVVRDIFSEPVDLIAKKDMKREEEPKLPPKMTLKGTIVGGDKPIAIINERFVRLGDMVGDYQVAQIDKNKVVLRSDKKEITLDVMSHVQN